jgi:hypothetical protein
MDAHVREGIWSPLPPCLPPQASNQTAGGRWLRHSEGELEVDWGGWGEVEGGFGQTQDKDKGVVLGPGARAAPTSLALGAQGPPWALRRPCDQATGSL